MAALRQLFAVVENYPDLKANQNFLALQAELTNTEDRLQTARRFYNANVRDYNRRVQSVPSNVVANLFHFEEEEFFEVEEALRGDEGVPTRELRGGRSRRVVREPVGAFDRPTGHASGRHAATGGAATRHARASGRARRLSLS